MWRIQSDRGLFLSNEVRFRNIETPRKAIAYSKKAHIRPTERAGKMSNNRAKHHAGISAVIITLNEEHDIESALKSVDWCDEIIVVNSGSRDRTVEICRKYNCRVYHKDFQGFGEQKQFAIEQASNLWILSIDADEIITTELNTEITAALKKGETKYTGFTIPITTVLWDKVIRSSERYTRPKLRLFNRSFGGFSPAQVHEGVQVSGKVGRLSEPMYNFAYSSIGDYFHKFNSYTSFADQRKPWSQKEVLGLWLAVSFPNRVY